MLGTESSARAGLAQFVLEKGVCRCRPDRRIKRTLAFRIRLGWPEVPIVQEH